mgnify:FL=1
MARYKRADQERIHLLPVNFNEQILPGTFEYTLNFIVEEKIDFSIFHGKHKNDETGAPAFSPKVLLKIVLFAYSKGILSSRKIAEACKNNIVFMALSGNSFPHFTTIADFVSSMKEEISQVFLRVLLVCDQMKLIGGDMFAVDGCKLSSNASQEVSGTLKDLEKKKEKFLSLARHLLEKHAVQDKGNEETKNTEKERETVERILQKADKIEQFLQNSERKMGSRGREIQSNITDNESAKMKTSHGVVQGYNGLAMTDSKNQIIVYPEAYGSGQEGILLKDMVDKTQAVMEQVSGNAKPLKDKLLLADTNYFSEENLKYLAQSEIEAIIPDPQFRKRDERFKDRDRFNPNSEKRRYSQEDFSYDEEQDEYICPGNKRLRYHGEALLMGKKGRRYMAKRSDCSACGKRRKCLKNYTSRQRSLMFTERKKRNYSQEMQKKIDREEIRKVYGKRMGIVEPVFGNISYCKGMNRFTLRGKAKVNIQWTLYCLVHNIEKISRSSEELIHIYGKN